MSNVERGNIVSRGTLWGVRHHRMEMKEVDGRGIRVVLLQSLLWSAAYPSSYTEPLRLQITMVPPLSRQIAGMVSQAL